MDEMTMTWGDAEAFVKDAGLDQDEYFHLEPRDDKTRKTVIWDQKGLVAIAAWWTPGTNEGYYVHVDRVLRGSQGKGVRHELAMVGKFWHSERAALASELLTRLFYGLFKDPVELVEAARK